MIDYKIARMEGVSVHRVGNETTGEPLLLAEEPMQITDHHTRDLLLKYFLSAFSTPEYYSFTFSNGDPELNPVHRLVRSIFEEPVSLHERSQDLARYLYDIAKHPNIRSGDFFAAYFEQVQLGHEATRAIGLFKSESKESFLHLSSENKDNTLTAEEGIHTDKLDKGCLILDMNAGNGFKILVVDRNRDTQYWRDSFLKLAPLADNYYFTQNYLSITKNFVTQQLNQEFEVSRADQIDLLNKSVEYFKTADRFNEEEFTSAVFGDNEVISSFRQFKQESLEESELKLEEDFDISAAAVKKQSRIFKSVLKLDRNFHIYIHGNRELIEKGVDEKGRKYYKIYYTEES